MSSVVVFGATSYVGQHLIARLLEKSYRVIAVTRRPAVASILLNNLVDRIDVVSNAEFAHSHHLDVAAVVNLAYVKRANPDDFYETNRRLIEAVHQAAVQTRTPRLVHVSSMAVFGYTPKAPPTPTETPVVLGNLYVESKGYAERDLRRLSRNAPYQLAMVRLGNVIGPGSPTWVAPLCQRILEGKPVIYQAVPAASNATDVVNVADYLAHLVEYPVADLAAFGNYHHLAEFSSQSWHGFLQLLSDTIGRPYEEALSTQAPAPTMRKQTYRLLKSASTQALGGYARIGLSRFGRFGLVKRITGELKQLNAFNTALQAPALSAADQTFLSIVSTSVEFRSHVLSGWSPPTTYDDACARITRWVKDSGYVIAR